VNLNKKTNSNVPSTRPHITILINYSAIVILGNQIKNFQLSELISYKNNKASLEFT
jgi:hypothetical protein